MREHYPCINPYLGVGMPKMGHFFKAQSHFSPLESSVLRQNSLRGHSGVKSQSGTWGVGPTPKESKGLRVLDGIVHVESLKHDCKTISV